MSISVHYTYIGITFAVDRNTLVAGEVALALVLPIAANLVVRN